MAAKVTKTKYTLTGALLATVAGVIASMVLAEITASSGETKAAEGHSYRKKIVMSNRVWAQLDTLLTSDTITEAMEISHARAGRP